MPNKEKQNTEKRLSLLAAVILLSIIYVVLNFKQIFVYLALVTISAFVQYNTYRRFPKIDIGHVFFIGFIIEWHDGFAGEVMFVLLAGLMPELLNGYIELKTFISYPLMIAMISIPFAIVHSNYVILGIICAVIYYLLMFFISGFMREPIHERLFEIILPLVLNIIYFMYLAVPLFNLLDIAM